MNSSLCLLVLLGLIAAAASAAKIVKKPVSFVFVTDSETGPDGEIVEGIPKNFMFGGREGTFSYGGYANKLGLPRFLRLMGLDGFRGYGILRAVPKLEGSEKYIGGNPRVPAFGGVEAYGGYPGFTGLEGFEASQEVSGAFNEASETSQDDAATYQ